MAKINTCGCARSIIDSLPVVQKKVGQFKVYNSRTKMYDLYEMDWTTMRCRVAKKSVDKPGLN